MNDLLILSLEAAVPLWIERLQAQPWSEVERRAQVAVDVVASKGDIILFRSSRKGETAEAFNRLAEGVAALSFAPGGVTVFGLHFDAEHPDQ